ncbi:sulfotransferase family protein [Desulfosporosinus nitroreducens]|uniref:sulfotransferase family protein n=1 Tax=Desulfosporosinus nitroreducens TaxID=2018668 RepID=UPI00207D0E83|nr:sulfotransferase [Desulfosporosinus nitroreducens]MCO1600970.1 sulfotransferase [Desulfosporosinus nitroreducens]
MTINKPNLFIVGTQKSGSTSLYNYLSQHPEIFFPKEKEPRFFNLKHDIIKHNGPGDTIYDSSRIINEYEYYKLFNDVGTKKIIGDATIEYLYYPDVAHDLKVFNKTAKIIIILRNPIDRAYSAYNHLRRDLRENLSFEDALDAEDERIKLGYHQIWHYKQVGKYYRQVKSYLDVFGRSNVKIILNDYMKKDIEIIINDIEKFLEIKVFPLKTSINYNVSGIPKNVRLQKFLKERNLFKYLIKPLLPRHFRENIKTMLISKNIKKIPINENTRRYLIDFYREDVLELQDLIGEDLKMWLV